MSSSAAYTIKVVISGRGVQKRGMQQDTVIFSTLLNKYSRVCLPLVLQEVGSEDGLVVMGGQLETFSCTTGTL